MQVFRIQNERGRSSVKTKIMPSSAGIFVRYMSPRFTASHERATSTLTVGAAGASGNEIVPVPSAGGGVVGARGQVVAGSAAGGGGSASGVMHRPASGAAVIVGGGGGGGGGGDGVAVVAASPAGGDEGSSTRWHVALPSTHRERSIEARMGPAF
jgi:hypothetical protein